MDIKRIKALELLMPLGGYTDDGVNITIIEDHGYSIPTQGEIDAAIAKVESNEPILQQLDDLDEIVTRKKEDKAIELGVSLDPVEQAVVDEKLQLRNQLV